MSVTPNQIATYGSLKMPEADSVTVGGGVDTTKRVAWYDLSANDSIDVVSSAAGDTATKGQVAGRDATGVIQTPAAFTLNGTTPVVGIGSTQVFERLLYGILSGGNTASGSTFPLANPTGTAATGDVAFYRHTPVVSAHTAQAGSANTSGTTPPLFKLQAGDGASVALGQIIRIKTGTGANQLRQIIATTGYGTDVVAVNRDWTSVPDATSTYDVYQGMLFEISPNPVTAITRLFATSAADVPGGSNRSFYEQVFAVNNSTLTALTGAQIEVASETPSLPSGALLDAALTSALNDTGTVANRQTAPASGIGSFITQPSFISVPGPGNLPAGASPNAAGAQGIWLRLTLPAGTAAYKGSADLRVQGTTT